MARLWSKTRNTVLISDLQIADRFWSRMKGLLGRSGLSMSQALWIKRCNSVHTFGMKFTIDCIFVDKELTIKALKPKVKPGVLIWPIWGADSVIEAPMGFIEKVELSVGEQLHVGH